MFWGECLSMTNTVMCAVRVRVRVRVILGVRVRVRFMVGYVPS